MNRIVKTFLETPEYCGSLKVRLPLWIAEGSPGKSVFLCAAQHGRELHGTAALSEVFCELAETPLTGTVVMMPLMNPLGCRCACRISRPRNRVFRTACITVQNAT